MIWLAMILGSVGLGWLLGGGDASENVRSAAAGLPVNLLGLLLGFTIGLYRRERIRLRRTYASPTVAYLGKALLFASAAASVTAVASPVAWPAIVLPATVGAAAVGTAFWVGNLPSRL